MRLALFVYFQAQESTSRISIHRISLLFIYRVDTLYSWEAVGVLISEPIIARPQGVTDISKYMIKYPKQRVQQRTPKRSN